MALSHSNTGILIINTFPAEFGTHLGSSEKSFAAKLGSEFHVRTMSAVGNLDGPIPEQGVILNGSPYSLLQPLDWIEKYRRFIHAMTEQGKILLGVCFGHQGLAETFEGTVENRREPQFGIQRVRLTEEGKRHPLFHGLPEEMHLPASHFDHVVQIHTTRQKILATTDACPVYAIEVETENNGIAWGIQFHPEMNGERLAEVIEMKKENIPDWKKKKKAAKKAVLDDCGEKIIANYGRAVVKAKRH